MSASVLLYVLIGNQVVPIEQSNLVWEPSGVRAPVRAVLENLGAHVSYDAASQTVTARRDGLQLRLQVGDSSFTLNEKPLPLAAPVEIREGRVVAPVRPLAEAMGANVKWIDNFWRYGVVSINPPDSWKEAYGGAKYTPAALFGTYIEGIRSSYVVSLNATVVRVTFRKGFDVGFESRTPDGILLLVLGRYDTTKKLEAGQRVRLTGYLRSDGSFKAYRIDPPLEQQQEMTNDEDVNSSPVKL